MATTPNAGGLSPLGRRRHYRHQIQSLAYVNLDQGNGGIIRNLGDSGIAIKAVAPLVVNQQVFLRFELSNPRVRVEATGRVAWVDAMGQAGMEFLSLPQRSGRLLKEWIFIQLMALAGVVPPWPMALVMGLGAAAVFAVLYRFMFLFWMGGTPGNWLAGLTGDESLGNEVPADERPRFR